LPSRSQESGFRCSDPTDFTKIPHLKERGTGKGKTHFRPSGRVEKKKGVVRKKREKGNSSREGEAPICSDLKGVNSVGSGYGEKEK